MVARKAEDVNLQNIGLAIMSYFIWISELDPTSEQQNHYRENMLVLLVGNLKEPYVNILYLDSKHPKYHLEKTLSGLEFRLTKTQKTNENIKRRQP